MVFELVFDFALDLLDSPDERAQRIEDVELPLGGKVVGRLQDALLPAGKPLLKKVVLHALVEAAADASRKGRKLLQHPEVELGAVLVHHAVEDRGLDVRQENPLEQFEYRPLNEGLPGDVLLPAVLLALGKHPGNGHLVGLLVKLGELHWIDLVVPTTNAGRTKNQLD